MTPIKSQSENAPFDHVRLEAVDSLRGLAALFVLFGHTLGSFAWSPAFVAYPIINNFFDGRSAVTMFFVLSGFVLTFGHFNDPGRPFFIIPFYVRRLTRIWLPWLFVFTISAAAKQYIPRESTISIPQTSEWLNSMWQGPTTFHDVLAQMFFQLHSAERMLMCQDWSLGVELRASAFIPLLIILARWRWASLIAVGIGITYLKESGFNYAPFFAGVLVAYWNSKKIHVHRPAILLLLGVILYQARWVSQYTNLFPGWFHEREIWLLSTVGCLLLLAGTLRCGWWSILLERRLFLYLGRVSYSTYLLQMIILICVAPWVLAGLNSLGATSTTILQPLLLLIIAVICLGLADLSQRFVEVPCIRLGKRLTNQLLSSKNIRRIRL